MAATQGMRYRELEDFTPRKLAPINLEFNDAFASLQTPTKGQSDRVMTKRQPRTPEIVIKTPEFVIKTPKNKDSSTKLASMLNPFSEKPSEPNRPKTSNSSLQDQFKHPQSPRNITRERSLDSKVRTFRALNNDSSEKLILVKPYLSHRQKGNVEAEKSSIVVKGFGANTNEGIVRNYNEDKVSIVLNITKPTNSSLENWPKCSFFGIYDGHGGSACADFLRDNLYRFVTREAAFPTNPKEALMKGFLAAEASFFEVAEKTNNLKLSRSGSCALVALIVDDMCYIANVGDSRAVMSSDNGQYIYDLSKDHKPSEESEMKRIIEAGGMVYQSGQRSQKVITPVDVTSSPSDHAPYRVYPGRLSVSRTFGDLYAKSAQHGGNPNVVIAEPEIKAFKINPSHDFIILASDGVYDKLSSKECIRTVWNTIREGKNQTTQEKCASGVEELVKEAMARQSLDNVTAVMISFSELVTQRKNTSFLTSDKSSQFSENENSLSNSWVVKETERQTEESPPQKQPKIIRKEVHHRKALTFFTTNKPPSELVASPARSKFFTIFANNRVSNSK
eukprot:CAMPEP_0176444504 /NCGR_PEP_ID=MMETSP0127-20121128/23103_1 /TAXON_ID=938130 /ORGANISM="Platyophrya macrostoma, Strain WH" /LENGTH=561 /DNA_ID=CAMNT_0017830027 /DNA_START=36 /DNA_END=1721 /DNA_ORIENTATION=+